ncbi:MAG: sulfite exporter TauE/SafE family protein [SAR324 cluster bacterium]|nr:sulfite exporter TauE/SafE family protein [SAR324 cluster bacterium]
MDSFVPLMIDGTGLTLAEFWILCGISLVGSFLTAALGIGGGTLALAVMALILPPTILIPIHAVVQIGSNGSRVILLFRDIVRPVILPFLIGTLIGGAVGAKLVIILPTSILQGILAVFIVYATWAPKFQARKPSLKAFFGLGVFATFATMFVGATGPLVAPFVSAYCEKRQSIVATHAILMTIQHSIKIVAFGILGFAFGSYIPLLVGLLVFGFVGTYLGKMLLNRLPEYLFKMGLRAILTLLAIRLMYAAISA